MSQKSGSYLYDLKSRDVCSLSFVEYRIELNEFSTHTETTQRYKNSSSNPQELTYRFFVNKMSTIYNVEIEIYDPENDTRKQLVAKIMKKEEAQEKYDDAIAEGNTAMLVEEVAGEKDLVSLNIGNVAVDWELTIKMCVVQEADIEISRTIPNSKNLKVFIPSINYRPGKVKKEEYEENVSIEVEVSTIRDEIVEVKSPSHEDSLEVTKSSEDNNSAIIKLKKMISLSTNFILLVTVASKNESTDQICIVEKDEKTNDYSAMVTIMPRFEDEDEDIMTEVIFLLDCSGSMSGSRMNSAKKSLRMYIEKMSKKKKVRANIIKFGSSVTSLYPNKTVDLGREENVTQILKYIDDCSADMGGTNIFDAIKTAMEDFPLLQTEEDGFYSRQLVLLSDGEDYRCKEIVQYVRKNITTTRIFSIGIGSGINPVFMRQIANCTNGKSIFIQDWNTQGDDIDEHLDYLLQKSITGIHVQFTNDQLSCKNVLELVPSIYNFEKFSMYYFLDRVPQNDIILTYYSGKKKHKETIQVINFDNTNNNNEEEEEEGEEEETENKKRRRRLQIGVLSGKKRVLEIEDYKLQESEVEQSEIIKKELQDEVVEISLKYQFLTSFTSFLLVHQNEDSSKIDQEMTKKDFSQLVVKKKRQQRRYTPTTTTTTTKTSRRRMGGVCYSSSSIVMVLSPKSNKIKKKRICELQEGELVQSFDHHGKLKFVQVMSVFNPFDKKSQTNRLCEVIHLICENGDTLKVTDNHYVYSSKFKSDQQNYLNEYIMKISGLILPGEYLLQQRILGSSSGYYYHYEQVKIIKIEKKMEYVVNPFVMNTHLVVDNFCTSVLTKSDQNSLFFEVECPMGMDNRKEVYKLFEKFTMEEFVELVNYINFLSSPRTEEQQQKKGHVKITSRNVRRLLDSKNVEFSEIQRMTQLISELVL